MKLINRIIKLTIKNINGISNVLSIKKDEIRNFKLVKKLRN